MEEDKKQNSAVGKESIIIRWYQKLTYGEKNGLKVYIIWFLTHCALLGAGENHDCFFPWHYSRLEWDIDDYGLPEFIVYVALIPIVIYFIYSFYKKNKTKTL